MPQNTHHLQLSLLSFTFYPETVKSVIYFVRLTKGLWSSRQICFRVMGGCQTLIFQSNNVIDFFYTPIVAGRKDTFFRLVLEEMGEPSQLGDITFSTKQLADVFWMDKTVIMEGEKLITPYITIKYHIKRSLKIRTQPKIGFTTKITANDLMSQIFDFESSQPKQKLPHSTHFLTQKKKQQHIESILLSGFKRQVQMQSKKTNQLDASQKQPISNSIPIIKNHGFIQSQKNIKKRPIRLLSKLLISRRTLSESFELMSSVSSVNVADKQTHYESESEKKKKKRIPQKNTLMIHYAEKKQTSFSKKVKCIFYAIVLGMLYLIFRIISFQISQSWENL